MPFRSYMFFMLLRSSACIMSWASVPSVYQLPPNSCVGSEVASCSSPYHVMILLNSESIYLLSTCPLSAFQFSPGFSLRSILSLFLPSQKSLLNEIHLLLQPWARRQHFLSKCPLIEMRSSRAPLKILTTQNHIILQFERAH